MNVNESSPYSNSGDKRSSCPNLRRVILQFIKYFLLVIVIIIDFPSSTLGI